MGLIQREIESRGIRTGSIMHLPKVAEKTRPPRMFVVHYQLGETFSFPNMPNIQRTILQDLLKFAALGGDEEVFVSKYGKK